MKRILSCIVVCAILLFNINTFAAKVSSEADYMLSYDVAAETLSEFGLMHGDADGNLRTEDYLTRAEFAALITRILSLSLEKGASGYKDVSENHWAECEIAAVKTASVMSGYPDGSFKPDETVLFEEAASAFVNILGYSEKAASYGGYPWGTLLAASEVGITKGTSAVKGERVTRGLAAKIILNSLYIKPFDISVTEAPLTDIACPDVFFVSPDGDDENDGSYISPWKTFRKAAESLKAGQTALFENGVYTVDEAVNISSPNGKISFRARDAQGAEIAFSENAKVVISGENAICQFKGIKLLSDKNSIIVEANVKETEFTDNVITGKIIVAENSKVTIENNAFENGAVDITNSENITVSKNSFENFCDAALKIDGGSVNALINNNIFKNNNVEAYAAVVLGGSSSQDESRNGMDSKFELSDCALWNNVIVAAETGSIDEGIKVSGAKKCRIFNNTFSKVKTGILFGNPDNKSKGWTENPINEKINLRNNIFADSTGDAYYFRNKVVGFTSDYNLFYEAYPELMEQNSIYEYPEFINNNSDWRITSASGAAHRGENVSDVFTGFSGKMQTLDLRDMDGNNTDVRNIGAYQSLLDPSQQSGVSAISDTLKRFETTGSVLFSDDFRKNSRDNWTPAMGDWVAEDGMIKQILPSAGRAFLIYDKGNDWSDIEISIDLKSPKKDSNVGIAFRMTNGGKDAYVFRILPTGGVQFAKWINGKFTQIGYWEHPIENETYYNLGVRALGTKFTFYLNGEEIAQAEDASHSKGTVAFYSYLQESLFDNLKIATAE